MNDIELIVKEIDQITDRLGMHIDKEIRPAIIAFRSMGLSTSSSCQGHLHRALPYPWVEFNTDYEEENKRCFLIVKTLLSRSDNPYLYIWKMGIYSGFRLQTEPATSLIHLGLLKQEMNSFAINSARSYLF